MKKISILVGILILLGVIFGVYYYEGSLPVNESSKDYQNFVIERGDTVNEIINKLSNEELIRNRVVFLLIVKQLDIESNIQAGLFRLSPSMSAREIALSLTKGSDDVWVTIIEGLRKEEVAQILANEFDIPESEFIAQTEEGYLFPDTYLISRQATIPDIIAIFERNFNSKFTDELKQQAQAKGLTVDEVLTIASLVEREANSREAKRNVASIIYRRYLEGRKLEIDATVQYALGYQASEKDWWKKRTTYADLEVDSPYNTYLYPGLPPGPIASPGLDAIEAVIDADENTPYLFYISNREGSELHYAETFEEHQINIQKYLR